MHMGFETQRAWPLSQQSVSNEGHIHTIFFLLTFFIYVLHVCRRTLLYVYRCAVCESVCVCVHAHVDIEDGCQ